MTDVTLCTSAAEWNQLVYDHGGHPLQLWGWGEVKAAHGWRVERLRVGQGGAQLLIRALPGPLGSLVYVPRGPFGSLLTDEEQRQQLLEYIKTNHRPTVVTVEPDTVRRLNWKGWRASANHILMAKTAVLDLTQSEDELLAVMTKKTRQYIRKSSKEGITVRLAKTKHDIALCLAIYKQTAARAGFALHDDQYYDDIFDKLGADSPVYLAQHGRKTVAFLWPVVSPEVAFELYGGMNDEGQRLRANYHLKWSVIQAMKQRGVQRYDVNGLLNDGVSNFKRGFIPEETHLSGSYDYPMSPLYPVWSTFLPLARKVARLLR